MLTEITTTSELVKHVSVLLEEAVRYIGTGSVDVGISLAHQTEEEVLITDEVGCHLGKTSASDARQAYCLKQGLQGCHYELTAYLGEIIELCVDSLTPRVNDFPRLYLGKFAESVIPTQYSETDKTKQKIIQLVGEVFLVHRHKIASWFRVLLIGNYTFDWSSREISTRQLGSETSVYQSMLGVVGEVVERVFSELILPDAGDDFSYIFAVKQRVYKSFAVGYICLCVVAGLSFLMMLMSFAVNLLHLGSLVRTCGKTGKAYFTTKPSKGVA